MRAQAFRNLLLGYNLNYGIVLMMMLMLLLTGRNMGQGAAAFVIIVVTVMVAPAVAVNVGCLKRQSWGAGTNGGGVPQRPAKTPARVWASRALWSSP
ncbi:hypothetical protein PLCT2_01135 [Planctomycetaceae bacterium]|nr:hypothetical protein PLCT2_01135 [Planctomycetaceae bacterium]